MIPKIIENDREFDRMVEKMKSSTGGRTPLRRKIYCPRCWPG